MDQKYIEELLKLNLQLEQLKDSRFLITGANGLIGSFLCRTLDLLNQQLNLNITVLPMVRDEEKGKKLLAEMKCPDKMTLVVGDVIDPLVYDGDIEYIVHTACPTSGKFFSQYPVETITAIVDGTRNILMEAKNRNTKSVVYVSSMEVYGQVTEEVLLSEDKLGELDITNLRNSYPMGKRMAEQICIAMLKEYGVSAKSIRLAQTFGLGIQPTENRVFAQFLRSCQKNEDIIMHTEGKSKRMYLDTRDAISAILTVLLNGVAGEIYNAANPATYSSIREMAEFVLKLFGSNNKVVVKSEENVGQYPPDNMLKLDVSKLEALSWKPYHGMEDMYFALKEELEEDK